MKMNWQQTLDAFRRFASQAGISVRQDFKCFSLLNTWNRERVNGESAPGGKGNARFQKTSRSNETGQLER